MASTTIDSLSVKIESNASKATGGIDALAESLRKLGAALSGTSGISSLASDMNTLKTASKGMKGFSVSADSAGKSAKSFFSKLKIGYAAVANRLAKYVAESTKYVEDLNLFNASLGEYSESAQEYANKVADIMGIDPADWMRNQGVFQVLAEGFGVASDRALVMSQNPTQLGFDLSKAKLEAIALSLGIDETFDSMTQAEKAQLRYQAILSQVTVAQGDMARTLDAPSNQLRILAAQATQAARAVGNILIPALNAILPVAITVIRAIRAIADAIASLFGFSLPEIDYSGIEGATESVSDLGDELGSAGGAAKKLKHYLMGFDELNVIEQQDPSGGGGGSSASDLSDWDFDLLSYDFLGGLVESKIDSIWGKIKPIIDYVVDNMNVIKDIAIATAAVIATMKLTGLVSDFGVVSDTLKNGMKLTAIATISLVAHYVLSESYLRDGNALTKLADVGSEFATTKLLEMFVAKNFGQKYSSTAGGLLLTGQSVISLVTSVQSVAKQGTTTASFIQGIQSVLEGAIAGFKFGGVKGAIIGGTISLALNVVGTIVGANIYAAENLKQNIKFGDWDATQYELQQIIDGKFQFKATGEIISAEIANLNQAKEELSKKAAQVEMIVRKIRVGVITSIDDTALNDLVEQITGEGGLISQINERVAQSHKVIELGLLYAPPTDSEGNAVDITGGLITTLEEAQGMLNTRLQTLGNNLQRALMDDGFVKGLQVDKAEYIRQITAEILEIEQKINESQITGAFASNVVGGIESLSRESWDAFMTTWSSNESSLYTQLLEASKQAYAEVKSNIRMAGYMMSIAESDEEKASWQAVIDNLNASLDGWNPEERAREAADKFTEPFEDEIRTKLKGLIGDALVNGKFTNTVIAGTNLEQYVEELTHSMTLTMQENLTKEDFQFFLSAKETFGITEWDLFGEDLRSKFVAETVEMIGRDDTVAAFKALGIDVTDYIKNGMVSEAPTAASETVEAIQTAMDDNPVDVKVGTSNASRIVSDFIQEMQAQVDKNILTIKARVNYIIPETGGGNSPTVGLNLLTDKFSMKANGGFVNTGELFVAREEGAEMVGSIGNRTAVANNDQIVEAVSLGVYQAVSAAMSNTSGDDNTSIVINLDGEKIYQNQQKIARGKGYNLGMGAFSYGT